LVIERSGNSTTGPGGIVDSQSFPVGEMECSDAPEE